MYNISERAVASFGGLATFGIGIRYDPPNECPYRTRLLCDVTAEGKALLEDYFGAQLQLTPSNGDYVRGKPAIGSLMLPFQITESLATFAFFRSGALAVMGGYETVGIFDEEYLARCEAAVQAGRADSRMWLSRNPSLTAQA